MTLATPMPQIEAALDGLIDRLNEKSPFGAPPEPPKETVANTLAGALRAMTRGNPSRRKK